MIYRNILIKLAILGSMMFSLPGIGRDGTLPIMMRGDAFNVPRGTRDLTTMLRFDDNANHLDVPIHCELRSSQLEKTPASGTLMIGGKKYKVVGTCKDNLGSYEVVAIPLNGRDPRKTVSLRGKVEETNRGALNYKGIVTLRTDRQIKKYKFELKD